MASFYDTEVERQKKGDLTANILLPALAALEIIATAKSSKGQNVSSSSLDILKGVHGRRESALQRASQRDEALPGLELQRRYVSEFDKKDKARQDAINRFMGLPGLTDEDKANIQTDPFEFQKQAPERRLNQASVDPEVMDLLGKITDVTSYNSAKAKIASQYGPSTANKLMGPSFRTAMPMDRTFLGEGGLPGQQPGLIVVSGKGLATPVRFAEPGAAAPGHAGMGAQAPSGPQLVKPTQTGGGKTPEQIEAEAAAKARGAASVPKAMTAEQLQTVKMKLASLGTARRQIQGVKNALEAKKKVMLLSGKGRGWIPIKENAAFDKAVAALKPTIQVMTRVPGVGAMSDFETRLAMAPYPESGEYDDVNDQAIAALETLVDEIETGYKGMSGSPTNPGAALEGAFPNPAPGAPSAAPKPQVPEGTERINNQGVKMRMTGGKWVVAQ